MDTKIIITLILIAVTLYAFIKEIAAPDLIALTLLCLTVLLGLVDAKSVMEVFSNEAPLTIGALFVIGTALEKSGGVMQISHLMEKLPARNLRSTILLLGVITAFFSAFMNNTAIVAIMLPVTLGMARTRDLPASKLLIPLSYASILGGCCTLIGTSTNIVISGKLPKYGLEPLKMFELSYIGIPLCVIGLLYLTLIGPKLLPSRSSVIGVLNAEQRSTPLFHILIEKYSPLIGMPLLESPLFDKKNCIHLMEIRRNGERVMVPVNAITIQANDRFLIGVHGHRNKVDTVESVLPDQGITTLSKIEGMLTELVLTEESELCHKTLADSDFRQRYNAMVLAVHRSGKNITKKLATEILSHGDTLLVLTAKNNLPSLQQSHNFVLTDIAQSNPAPGLASKATLTWGILAALIFGTTVFSEQFPMHIATLVGAITVLWLRIITPRVAYAGVDWPIIFMLYGMLALGTAMENTKTAEWLAQVFVGAVRSVASPEWLLPMSLSMIILLTIVLTEVLSNNATALMMLPIVVKLAEELSCNPLPFVIGICIGASTAFMLPMGYQTHMMVYGPGGYKFSDFLRIGLPMNIISWLLASTIIPFIWAF
jgi:di/tricarboxylate transporter